MSCPEVGDMKPVRSIFEEPSIAPFMQPFSHRTTVDTGGHVGNAVATLEAAIEKMQQDQQILNRMTLAACANQTSELALFRSEIQQKLEAMERRTNAELTRIGTVVQQLVESQQQPQR